MDYYCVPTGWRNDPKRKTLYKWLGPDAVIAVWDLWSYCADSRTDGDLSTLDDDTIALAAGYSGNAGQWVAALTELGIIDKNTRTVCNWQKMNPKAITAPRRSAAGRKAAKIRWAKAKRRKAQKKPVEMKPIQKDITDPESLITIVGAWGWESQTTPSTSLKIDTLLQNRPITPQELEFAKDLATVNHQNNLRSLVFYLQRSREAV